MSDEWPTLEEIEEVLRRPEVWIEKAQSQEAVEGEAGGEVLAGEGRGAQD